MENTTTNDMQTNDNPTANETSVNEQTSVPIADESNTGEASSAAPPPASALEPAFEEAAEQSAPEVEAPQTEAPQAEAPQAEAPQAEARPSRQPSMAQIMESDEFSSYMSGVESLQRGALLRGTVVRFDENRGEALVDIGTKSEGIISKNEAGDEELNVGDEIEVVVLRPEDDEGHPILSKRRADYERTWREIQKAKDAQTNLEGLVREQVKGGLIVDLGVPAFVPASHVDARNRSDLSRFVGRTIPVRVIETDRKKNKVIASHRIASEEDRVKREAEAWGGLEKDKIVEGVVRRITDFGAFIDLGGIDGLLHVREMAWGRVDHPESVVKRGQKLQVLILDIDEEKKRVALGLKQLQSDPFNKAVKNYTIGQTLQAKVVRLAPTCAFVELEEGVEAIVPIGEISNTRINKPEDVLEVGQEVEARIKQIQANQRRITVSLKSAQQEREVRETRQTVREVNQRAEGGEGGGGGTRLGDLFGKELRAARDRGREREKDKDVARREAKERALQAAELEEWDDGADVEEVEAEEVEVDEIEAGVELDVSDDVDTDEDEQA